MSRVFKVVVTLSEYFTVDEIWPLGGAPKNPTIADVESAFFGAQNVRETFADWSLDDVSIEPWDGADTAPADVKAPSRWPS